ncbi:precorrin-3B synthase [Teichococcus vastitatis]|uniref:Precorrin-3B synthase n=1 Tax=Teichococcus vastitatis TaxID=2307076 RepID=A0ABS9WDV5_9PROT|nr:precorrin-3B synthase [Pseudoroseomonas vastitatis]MCI0757060.1 precorrin-3B synthase [Pseudoroseomonas vastitatis]
MTARRGWCPSLHEPMRSGDGWLTRVKPPRGQLTAAQARLIAGAAPGWIEATQRGNLQLRGFAEDALAPFAEAMRAAGLASGDLGIERRRNIIAPPLLGHDSTLAPGAAAWLGALEAMLADAALAELPGKFGLALDAGGVLPLGDVAADITLRLLAGEATLHIPGATARGVAPGHVAALIRAVLAVPGAGRLREATAALGPVALLARAGLRAEPPRPAPPAPLPVGLLPGATGFGLPFGQMSAGDLHRLADLAERKGDGVLCITPWRAILLPGLADPAMPAAGMGRLITDPDDPRLGIRACPGTAGCASGLADSRADAARIAALPRGPGLLHVSGCAKGCAHPGPAARVLVAEAQGRYALVRGGRAGDTPARRDLSLAEAAAELNR